MVAKIDSSRGLSRAMVAFVQGRRLFHLQYDSGEHTEVDNKVPAAEMAPYVGIAGPLFNQVNCEGCHVENNRGFPPAAGGNFESVVLKLASKAKNDHGGSTGDPNYGLQRQDKGARAEGDAQVLKGQELFATSGCVNCHAPNWAPAATCTTAALRS